MVKKIFFPVIAIIIVIAGGWFYTAERFETEASRFIENLKGSPFLTLEKATIDKYSFKINISNLGLKYDVPLKNKEFIKIPEKISLQSKGDLSFFYNPITKKASFDTSAIRETEIKADDISQTIEWEQTNAKSTYSLSFFQHPTNEIVKNIKGFLKNIKSIENVSSNVKGIDQSTKVLLISAKDVALNLKVESTPESDDFDLTTKSSSKELMIGEAIFTLLEKLIVNDSLKEEFALSKKQLKLKFPLSNENSLKIHLSKEEVEKFIESIKDINASNKAQILETLPSLSLVATASESNINGKQEGSLNVTYQKKQKSGSIDLNIAMEPTAESSKSFSLYLKSIYDLKLADKVPFKITTEMLDNIVPDFVSMSPLKLAIKGNFNFQKAFEIDQFEMSISNKDCGVTAKGSMNETDIVTTLDLVNYEKAFTDLENYRKKLIEQNIHELFAPMSKVDLDNLSSTQLKSTLEFLKKVGKQPEQQKSTLRFDIKINNADSSKTTINNKTVLELMTGQ